MKRNSLLTLFALTAVIVSPPPTFGSASPGDTLPQVSYTYSRYLSPTSAELVAGIRPNGREMRIWFRCYVWTAPLSYISLKTAEEIHPADTGLVEIRQTINGFPSDSALYYNYWVVVSSSAPDTIIRGRSQSSNTQFPLPGAKIVTLAADSVRPGSGMLRALVNSHGVPTRYRFLWGTLPFGTSGGVIEAGIDSTESDMLLSATVSSLIPATAYSYSLRSEQLYDHAIANSGEDQLLETPGDTNAVGLSVPLMIFSNTGVGQPYLNFGVHTYASHCIDPGLGESEMPPPPPAPVIDPRFRDPHRGNCFGLGTYLDLRTYSSPAQADTYKIGFSIDPSLYPITLRWPNLDSAYAGAVRFLMFGSTVDMKESTSCVIEDAEHSIATIIAEGPRPRSHRSVILMKRPAIIALSSVSAVAAVIPNGFSTRAWFEWGTTMAYGNVSPAVTIGPSSGLVDIWGQLTSPNGTYHYRVVTQNDYGTTTGPEAMVVTTPAGSSGGSPSPPRAFRLEQNNPNPFNAITHIRFTLNRTVHVALRVYNVLGQHLETLLDEEQAPGPHDVRWDAGTRPSGTYFYRLTAGGAVETRGMAVVR